MKQQLSVRNGCSLNIDEVEENTNQAKAAAVKCNPVKGVEVVIGEEDLKLTFNNWRFWNGW